MNQTAYIALGSNLGDRAQHIRDAIAALRATRGIEIMRESSLIENPAIGGPEDSPDFLNGVIEVSTSLSPHDLLQTLLRIERELGRVRSEKWSPRTIDLDLLLFNQRVIDDESLKIPHPRMHERAFVLIPLAEIAPHFKHPVLDRTIAQIASSLRHDRA